MLVHFALTGLLAAAAGCAGGSAVPRDGAPLVEPQDRSDDDLLFDAVLDVFAAQGVDLQLESRERGVVLSHWREVNREVRHRLVARVIRANMGLVLEVHSEYERRTFEGSTPVWLAADDPYSRRDAQREEQELGAAIQARFRALGGGR